MVPGAEILKVLCNRPCTRMALICRPNENADEALSLCRLATNLGCVAAEMLMQIGGTRSRERDISCRDKTQGPNESAGFALSICRLPTFLRCLVVEMSRYLRIRGRRSWRKSEERWLLAGRPYIASTVESSSTFPHCLDPDISRP